MESVVKRISFFIFLGALASLILLSTLPAPASLFFATKTTQIISTPQTSNTVLKAEKEPFVEPEKRSEAQWIFLLRKHLWRIAYFKNKKTLFEAKTFFRQIPENLVEPYIQNMLQSKTLSEMTMGAIAVRYLALKGLLPQILKDLSPVGEDAQDARVPFYLAALEIGEKDQVASALFPYLDSEIIHHRLIALESLAQLKCSEVIPQLVKRLSQQKQNSEFHTLSQTITQLITPEQYPALIELSLESRPELRRVALSMMESVDLNHFISHYKQALKDPDLSVRRQAYFCFLKLRETSLASYFLELAQNALLCREERILALEVANHCGKNLKSKKLDPFLKSPDPLFRFVALTIQANLKDASAIPALIELLEVKNSEFIIGQGSDLEEERTWLFKQIHHVLKVVTQKEVSAEFSWKQWWSTQSKFKFPEFSYMENPPSLYEER